MAKPLKQKGARCPVCGKPQNPDFTPFCSEKCSDIDLNRWLDGQYRIPTEEKPGKEPPPEED